MLEAYVVGRPVTFFGKIDFVCLSQQKKIIIVTLRDYLTRLIYNKKKHLSKQGKEKKRKENRSRKETLRDDK